MFAHLSLIAIIASTTVTMVNKSTAGGQWKPILINDSRISSDRRIVQHMGVMTDLITTVPFQFSFEIS